MVSKAREDLPEPLSPVITVSVFRGMRTLMFFRLCWRAPETVISCNILLIIETFVNPGTPSVLSGMESCIGCGHRASRKRRGIFRKVVCRAAYECDHCGLNWHDFRPLFAIFQSCCLCPRCHNPDLTKLASRDKLDRMSP